MAALESCAPEGAPAASPMIDIEAIRETFEWPREKVATLIRMHGETAPFSEIARIVRKTKNACIGKARRLGLPERDGQERVANHRKVTLKNHPRRKPKRKPLPPCPNSDDRRHTARAAAEALTLPAMSHGRISDLSASQCRWPIGDPKAADFGFCGRLKAGEGAYCAVHAAAAVNPHSTAKSRTGDRKLARDLRRFA